MVVESLYASVAVIAMGGTGWTEDVTTVAEFDFEVVSFYGHCVDTLDVTHQSGCVVLTERNFVAVYVLVGHEHFRYHAWVSECQNNQDDFNEHVEQDSEHDESSRRHESSDDIVKNHPEPKQAMRCEIFCGLRYQTAECAVRGVVHDLGSSESVLLRPRNDGEPRWLLLP